MCSLLSPHLTKNVSGETLHRRGISHTQAASLCTDNAQARSVCTWAKHLTCPLFMVVIPDGRIGAVNPSLSISTFADNTHYRLQHVGFISIMPHRPIAPSLQTTHTLGERHMVWVQFLLWCVDGPHCFEPFAVGLPYSSLQFIGVVWSSPQWHIKRL